MKRIVLIRHGESVWNKENRFTGYGAAIAWGIVVIVTVFAIINFFATRERRA